jgi:hypothetical protein
MMLNLLGSVSEMSKVGETSSGDDVLELAYL